MKRITFLSIILMSMVFLICTNQVFATSEDENNYDAWIEVETEIKSKDNLIINENDEPYERLYKYIPFIQYTDPSIEFVDFLDFLQDCGLWIENNTWFFGMDDDGNAEISIQNTIQNRTDEEKMILSGIIMMALIDKIKYIEYSYSVNEMNLLMNRSIGLDISDINKVFEIEDIKTYSESPKRVSELLELIYNLKDAFEKNC